jgi:hypothetical protein
MSDQQVMRNFYSRMHLDESLNPPGMVHEKLPTVTKKIFARTKMGGTAIDSTHGAVNFGSLAFSGSHRQFTPGSYALRVIRRTLSVGSMASDGRVWWKLHHSRLGTIDSIGFRKADYSPWLHSSSPMAPLYALGPGTITMYWQSQKGTHRVSASMEGVF